jgi:hypothetical protein
LAPLAPEAPPVLPTAVSSPAFPPVARGPVDLVGVQVTRADSASAPGNMDDQQAK